jgi:hypothetical protein
MHGPVRWNLPSNSRISTRCISSATLDSLARIQGFPNLDTRYLVHEYLHDKWTPFYFADIARELADAKLSFAGSARFPHMAPVG